MRTFITLSILITFLGPLGADDLVVFPKAIALRPPHGEQQMIVVSERAGRATADRTDRARFQSSDPRVAMVSTAGLVTLVGDGTAEILATVDGQSAKSMVTVSGTKSKSAWSLTQHVEPTLTRSGCNSGACHGALAGKGGFKLSLRGYDPESDWFTITRQAQARRIDGAAPAESLLLRKATRALPHGGGTRFDDESASYRLLKEWIATGAPGPNRAEPRVESVAVYPPNRLAGPGDRFRVIAVATYADGRTEDVTRWAKFTSSEEQVATVDEDGQVKIAGSGVAGVSIVFGTHVATSTITVPFATKSFVAAAIDPRLSRVDRLILEQLNNLKLTPAAACTDEEFIRRASLDTCGIVPTPTEVAAFVADRSPGKRSQLIDRLLARPEYVDYWTYRWSDLLLVSTRDLPATANWSYYRSVRQAVADNVPWNRFARELLTATGSTSVHGSANYFVLHKDVAKLAETTSLTFLGTSIGCAKCHNHPLEKWTQDQYWQFANLFARVQLKNGDTAGEVIVTSSPTGDVLHLRRGEPMPPAPLDGPALPLDSPVDRRVHFVDWLTARENPFFARAIVNRVWKAYMGRGLVEAEDDLRATNPPTNPPLFDALTADFIAGGYDLKALMRTILTSEAYGRSSHPTGGNAADDRFYSRYFLRRLPAEVILDAYSQITGVPTPFDTIAVGASGGFARKDDFPAGTRAVQLPDSLLVSRFLDQFGRAERLQACACERGADASVGQALHVSNGQTLNDKLRDERSVVHRWIKDKATSESIVGEAFQLTLCRRPTEVERNHFLSVLNSASNRREAIEDVLWALLTGREFLFNR
jgi:hypothetical protein